MSGVWSVAEGWWNRYGKSRGAREKSEWGDDRGWGGFCRGNVGGEYWQWCHLVDGDLVTFFAAPNGSRCGKLPVVSSLDHRLELSDVFDFFSDKRKNVHAVTQGSLKCLCNRLLKRHPSRIGFALPATDDNLDTFSLFCLQAALAGTQSEHR